MPLFHYQYVRITISVSEGTGLLCWWHMASGVMLLPSERVRVIRPEVVTRRNVYTVTFSCVKYGQAMRGRIVAEHLQQDTNETTENVCYV